MNAAIFAICAALLVCANPGAASNGGCDFELGGAPEIAPLEMVAAAYTKLLLENDVAPLSDSELREIAELARQDPRALFEFPKRIAIGREPIQDGLRRLAAFVDKKGEKFHAEVVNSLRKILSEKTMSRTENHELQREVDKKLEQVRPSALNLTEKIDSLVVSRDGTLLAAVSGSSGKGSAVSLYDSTTLRLTGVIKDEALPWRSPSPQFDFSEDGRYFITAERGRIAIFEVATQKRVGLITEQETFLLRLRAKVRKALPGRRRPDEGSELAAGFAVAPHGNLIATSAWNGTIWIRELPTGKVIKKFFHRTALPAVQMKFSPDGKRLLASYFASNSESAGETVLWVWDVATGNHDGTVRFPVGLQHALFVQSPSGKFVVATNTSQGYAIALRDSHVIKEFTGSFTPENRRLAFSPDGRFLYASTMAGRLSSWKVIEDPTIQLIPMLDSIPFPAVNFLRYISGDMPALATVQDDRKIELHFLDEKSGMGDSK